MFATNKQSEQVYLVEEEDKQLISLNQQDFKKRLEEGKIKDGSLVTQVTIMERYVVITVKELQRISDGSKEG
jgi:hypothetical protein